MLLGRLRYGKMVCGRENTRRWRAVDAKHTTRLIRDAVRVVAAIGGAIVDRRKVACGGHGEAHPCVTLSSRDGGILVWVATPERAPKLARADAIRVCRDELLDFVR